MREVLGFLIFLGIGVIIAAATLWYVTTVIQWWRANAGPPSLGSVTVLGLQDAQAKAMAEGLPAIILSELRRLGERTKKAKRQLRELEQTPTQQAGGQETRFDEIPISVRAQETGFDDIPIPETLKKDVAFPQQIGGVEVGWLLTWIKDLLASTNVINFTVSYEADGKKATLFGHAQGSAGYAFFVRDETGLPDQIAQAAATSIIQNEQRRGEIAVQPLPPSDYLPFVDALSAYATYEKVVRSYPDQLERPNYKDEYISQLKIIEKIAKTYPQWGELQWLAAEIADRAGDREKALAFTQNEQRITPRDDPRYPRLAARLRRLTESSIAAASSADKRENDRKKAGQLLDEHSAAPFRTLIGVPAPPPAHGQVRIALVGQPWEQALKAVQNRVLREAKQHESISDYTTGLMQTARIVAPDAMYEFAGVEGTGAGVLPPQELLTALVAVQKSDAEVLIFGYGPASVASLASLRQLSGQMVVVISAGNDGGTSSFAPLDDVALVVSAVDSSRQRAKFADTSTRSVSAPGVSIPTVSAATGGIVTGSGTSYSAAFVGGAAVLLKAQYPKAKPAQIVAALRDTARQPHRMIDVTAASRRLGEMLQTNPATN